MATQLPICLSTCKGPIDTASSGVAASLPRRHLGGKDSLLGSTARQTLTLQNTDHGGDSLASGRLQSTSEEAAQLLAIDLDEILAGARRREHEAATRHPLGKLLPTVTIVKEQL